MPSINSDILRSAGGFTGDAALRSGLSAISGGQGAAIRRATQAATDETVDQAAKKIAARFARPEEETPDTEPVMVGLSFFLMLALTLLKDVSDIVADMFVVLSMLTPVTTILVSLIVGVYLYMQRVELSTNKLAAYLLSLVFEFVPFLNMIPTTSLVLVLTRVLENKRRARAAGGEGGGAS